LFVDRQASDQVSNFEQPPFDLEHPGPFFGNPCLKFCYSITGD